MKPAGRLEELSRRAERQREELAGSISGIASDVREHRMRWKIAGMTATGIAAAGTAAYRLFGKASPAARIGRAASATSIVLGLGRAFLRLRKFL
ncbi:MAG: hypothetical protein ABI592_09500 [Acidobacteriota bacterium]